MKYITWLKNRNLSSTTIEIYLNNANKWKLYLANRNPNKTLFVNYINDYATNHKPRSIKLVYYSILSLFKFEKKFKLILECKDLKLPSIQYHLKSTITLNDFKNLKKPKSNNFLDQRNYLIFHLLFFTGLRASELLRFDKSLIYDSNKLLIQGKDNKYRVIFLNDKLLKLLNNWKHPKVCIASNKKLLTIKQLNVIVKEFCLNNFNKYITTHGLRRSYATNLLKNNVNIEVVRRILGHTNINTTSNYLHYTDDEIIYEIKKVL